MLLELMSWQEVEKYLSQNTGIIIPIGSTEQHGPRGLLGTDALCPTIIAEGISEMQGIAVAPTLSLGIAQHHLGFAGTITLKPSTLIALISDVVASLTKHGFTHFYFLNGHGGNIATIEAAFAEIRYHFSIQSERPKKIPQLKLQNWWKLSAITTLIKELFGDAEGSHATPAEISLTYFKYPHAVKHVKAVPDIAPRGPIADAFDYRERFPDGRIAAHSNLATIEAGKIIYDTAVTAIAADYQDFNASK